MAPISEEAISTENGGLIMFCGDKERRITANEESIKDLNARYWQLRDEITKLEEYLNISFINIPPISKIVSKDSDEYKQFKDTQVEPKVTFWLAGNKPKT